MGRPASAADGDTVKIEVGDWVRWRFGRGYGFNISVVTEVKGTEVMTDDKLMVGKHLISEVRPPNKEPR